MKPKKMVMAPEPTQEEKQKLYEQIIEKHKLQIALWAKQHPGFKPPVYWDPEQGNFFWASRQQLRRIQREGAKLARRTAEIKRDHQQYPGTIGDGESPGQPEESRPVEGDVVNLPPVEEPAPEISSGGEA